MLTIKQVSANGFEWVFPATSVVYAPSGAESTSNDAVITASNGPEWCERLRGGTVYVMNEDGKTVATYKLGDKPDAYPGLRALGTEALHKARIKSGIAA